MTTLGELRAELRKQGIRPVGTLRVRTEDGPELTTIYFSADEKIVFPFAPKTIYPLVVNGDSDDEPVNSEKVAALKRYFFPQKG